MPKFNIPGVGDIDVMSANELGESEPIRSGPNSPHPSRPPRPSMTRGVDLAKVRNKSKHQHQWIVVANFNVDPAVVRQMEKNRDSINSQLDRGVDPENIVAGNVKMELDQAHMIAIDGPGCRKCGVHWQDENKGLGMLCDVSDDDAPLGPVTPPPVKMVDLSEPGVPDGFIPVADDEPLTDEGASDTEAASDEAAS